jgi:hypothetical protein
MLRIAAFLAVTLGPILVAYSALGQTPPQQRPQGTPNQIQQQNNQMPAERYRARITGVGQDGGAIAINTTYEWGSREECQNGATRQGSPVADLVGRLGQSGVAQNLNVQCRKMPSRTTNATPNNPGGQGTSQRESATTPVFQQGQGPQNR